IYAGAQKNLGTSGATLVIMKESLLGKVQRAIPTMLDYRSHIKDNSLHNTPSTFAIYVCMLTLRWLKEQGGITAMEKRNRAKAALLYAEIDRNALFEGNVAVEDRSLMNIPFRLPSEELEETFAKEAKKNNLIGLKGHRSVGGMRASVYNAVTVEGAKALVDFMKEFQKKNG
ncbi:MAG TPA: 3-phosphoserine/phosphohydroxythreonine transaminase, partial [Anaerolineales bacterium]|nr:3-phosphoserine/phosphohydroxythreonine transaminase [Anaerolineales bacterium]